MNLIKKYNHYKHTRGVRRLLEARRENSEKWYEILETADNQDVDREAVKYYLVNLGKKSLTRDPSAMGAIGGGIGAIIAVPLMLMTNNPYVAYCPLLIFIGGIAGELGGLYRSKRFEPYKKVRKKALANIEAKLNSNRELIELYSQGGAD